MNKKIIVVLIICLILSMSFTSTSRLINNSETFGEFSSDCPEDFSMFIYCGGLNIWSNIYMLDINANGEASYYNITYENLTIDNFTPVYHFYFTSEEINDIWNSIITNDFFNLNNHYERTSVCDGSFANITITGDGITHSVQTDNIDMYKLDNIVKKINSLSPGDYDLFYNALFNHAPVTPSQPSGTLNGNIKNEYTYTSISFDADDDDIYFLFDWGDDTNSGWKGPYSSGENISLNHKWNKKGDYNVRVKAIDDPNNDGNLSDGNESDWSNTLKVSMPFNKNVNTNILIDYLKKIFSRFTFIKYLRDFVDTTGSQQHFSVLNGKGSDPNSGTRGEIDEAKCEITITIDIKLYGKYVDKYSDKMAWLLKHIKDDIENKWNRDKWDKDGDKKPDGEKPWSVKCKDDCNESEPGCTVKFVAKVEWGKKVNGSNLVTGGRANSNAGEGHHWIELANPMTPAKFAYVNNWNGVLPTPNDGSETTGVFNVMDFETSGVFAHEAGHLMGLIDRYHEVEVEEDGKKVKKNVPNDGYNDSIMGTPEGWPSQADIDKIVKDSGIECPCKCCPEKNDTEKPKVKIDSPSNGSKVNNEISINGFVTDYDGSGVAELDYSLEWNGGSYDGNSFYIDPPLEYTDFELGPFYLEDYLDPDDEWLKFTIYAIDAAGNIGQNSVTVLREDEEEDTNPPITDKTIGDPNEDGGYTIWPFTPITLEATDDMSGVQYIYYEVWWDSNEDGIIDTKKVEKTVDDDFIMFSMDMYGIFFNLVELRWYAVDNADNIEEMHYQQHNVIP